MNKAVKLSRSDEACGILVCVVLILLEFAFSITPNFIGITHGWKRIGNIVTPLALYLMLSVIAYNVYAHENFDVIEAVVKFCIHIKANILNMFCISTIKKHLQLLRKYWLLIILSILVMWGICFLSVFSNTIGGNQEAINEASKITPAETIVMDVIGCVFAPIIEEMIFRGIFFEALNFRYRHTTGKIIIIVISSLLFALCHRPANLILWIVYSSLGLTLAFCRIKSKSLTCSICTHGIYNLLASF